MATYTTNYNLKKPAYADSALVEDLNNDLDTIDSTMKTISTSADAKAPKTEAVKNISRTGTTFTATRCDNTTFTFTQQDTTYSQVSRGSGAGLAPGLPSGSGTTKYLREDGSWQVPPNTTYSNATTSAAGLMSSTDKSKLDGIASGANNYSLPLAASGTRGGVQLGYSTSGKNYAVQQSGEKLYVNVPWTDTNTTYSEATSSTYGLVKTGYSTSGKNYAVQLSSGKMYVNVPWTDTNTWPTKTSQLTNDSGFLTSHQSLDSCLKTSGNMSASGVFSFTNTTESSSTTSGAVKISGGLGVAKNIVGAKVYNAVWNDYAEFRQADTVEPGRCVTEDKDTMTESTRRLMPACRLISDTYGSCMGETDKAKTPIAVAGRVLAFPFNKKRMKVGCAVCSAPNGTIDRMSRLECILFPDRIIGYVSEIPDYKVWQAGTKENPEYIPVNDRVWVYVR